MNEFNSVKTMKKNRFYLFTLILFGLLPVTLKANQVASAKVLSVRGSAQVQVGDGEAKPLVEGALLVQGNKVKTEGTGKVQLVFSNGSELTLKPSTSLILKELEQEPFLADKSYEQLEADPSKSKWLLQLEYGELSGHVKQLREDSVFNIITEFGTVEVYGTNFSVGYYYDTSTIQFIFSVENEDGLVNLSSQFSEDIDFGSGSAASVAFDPEGEKVTKFIPPGHSVRVMAYALNLDYNAILERFISNVVMPAPSLEERKPTFVPIDRPTVSPNTSSGS